MKLRYLIPLIVFVGIAIILWKGLRLHPEQVPSPLIDKPAPAFSLPSLLKEQQHIDHRQLAHQVTLLNVWATWCVSCAEEHAYLLDLAKNQHIHFIGLNYKDDQSAARKWLKQYGNPYQFIMVDQDGVAAIDWGVYGTPETFIIDKKGIIRYKHIGPLTPEIWNSKLKNLVGKLEAEPE